MIVNVYVDYQLEDAITTKGEIHQVTWVAETRRWIPFISFAGSIQVESLAAINKKCRQAINTFIVSCFIILYNFCCELIATIDFLRFSSLQEKQIKYYNKWQHFEFLNFDIFAECYYVQRSYKIDHLVPCLKPCLYTGLLARIQTYSSFYFTGFQTK